MRTTILIFQPHRREPQLVEFAGAVHRCVAFAPRNRVGRPLNVAATIAWDGALRREMGFGLIRRDGTRADQLAAQSWWYCAAHRARRRKRGTHARRA
jgi:hypothetical protein